MVGGAPRGARVVLVGRRRAARVAAERLGLDAVVWSDRRPAGVPAERHLPWEGVAAARRALAGGPPVAAVVALTEAAVVPAAELREALGVAGTPAAVAERATDKQLMKRAVAAAGLPCARFATAEDGLDRAGLVARLGLPIYLKQRRGSGGRGSSRLDRAAAVPDGVPPGMLAEGAIDGEEMSVEALVAGGRRLFTNFTEYVEPGWVNLVPYRLQPATAAAVAALLDRVLAALAVDHGLVHLELFLTAAGPVFGELALRPPGGHLLRLIELAWGFDPWRAWLELELGRQPRLPGAAARWAGTRLFHPGAGTLAGIAGAEAVAALPGAVELVLARRPGDRLEPRLGTGQEVGHLVVAGDERDAVAETLRRAGELLVFELAPQA